MTETGCPDLVGLSDSYPTPLPPNCTVDYCCGPYGCDPQSPIILDLDDNGIHLVGKADAVRFDIAATGTPIPVGWTRGGEGDAFLCLDRNKNGRIDSGAELFGNHTPLRNGRSATNGYLALAEFDIQEAGGNGNGVIDSGDAIWHDLRLWVDRNHDGISQLRELATLESAGIQEISLNYYPARRVDQYGNAFRFRSTAQMRNARDRIASILTTDVFLQIYP